MYQKLFILATLALSAVNAHLEARQTVGTEPAKPDASQTFKFTETFPAPYIIPTAKPEWLELIKNVNITTAPVYKNLNDTGPQPEVAGQDPYCDWTFTGCFGKDDLYQCPKGEWAVTYDDGPSEFSPRLYDYLDQAKVKATFFMVGGQVVKYPDYALRAYKSGHEIAMHTWSHNYMTTLTNEQIVAELKWNELAIKLVTGVSPRYFRPPYGDIDNRVRDVAAALGFVPIIWNYDTNDWAFASNPKTYLESWIDGNVTEWAAAASTATVGGVSLEHDLYNQTVDAAIRILPTLQKAYTMVPAGACNKVQLYKENVTVAATSAVASTSAAAATTVAAATTEAPTTAPTVTAANVSDKSGATSLVALTTVGLGATFMAALALL